MGLIAAPFALIGLKTYTKITQRERVRVLVTNENREVLLLKDVLSYRKWTLPGGGLNKNETAVACARRELHEETGILAPESSFQYVKTLKSPEIAVPFDAPLFHITIQKNKLPKKMANPHEVADIRWFAVDNLPSSLSQIAQYVLDEIYR